MVRYLAGTKELWLWFSQGDKGELEAFSNNDWGGSLSDQKSTSGMLLHLDLHTVSWSSRKQEKVSLSTTEVDYIVATSVASQVVWFKRILQECGHVISNATQLCCDNQSAIAVAKNPAHHGRMTHPLCVYRKYTGCRSNKYPGELVVVSIKNSDQKQKGCYLTMMKMNR